MKASSGKMTAASRTLSGNKGAQPWDFLCQAYYTIQTVWVGNFKSTVFTFFIDLVMISVIFFWKILVRVWVLYANSNF